MVKSIIKEIIIIILLVLAIVLALGVVFYDYLPTNRVVPTVETYATSEAVQAELEEKITQDETVLVTYEITSGDLKTLEKAKDYTKGKANPFSIYETVQGSSDGSIGGGQSGGSGSTGTSSGTSGTKGSTFYKDTGTK